MQSTSSNQLVVDHLKYAEALTVNVIDQFNLRPLISLDEALSFANAALTEAARRFKTKVGRSGKAVPFTTFSFSRIRGAVIDGLQHTAADHHRYTLLREASRSDATQAVPLPPDTRRRKSDSLDVERADTTESEMVDALAAREALVKAIRQLPEIEQQVIFLHYYEDMPCERFATRLGISGSYALRLRNKALRSLRQSLKDFDAEGAVQ